MRHILTKQIRILNGIGSFLLMLLGFSCSEEPDEYGTPYAIYQIKGRVEEANQEANQENIPDIRLTGIFGENDTCAVSKTDADGSFKKKKNETAD